MGYGPGAIGFLSLAILILAALRMLYAADLFTDVFDTPGLTLRTLEFNLLLMTMVSPPVAIAASCMAIGHAHYWTWVSKLAAEAVSVLAVLLEVPTYIFAIAYMVRDQPTLLNADRVDAVAGLAIANFLLLLFVQLGILCSRTPVTYKRAFSAPPIRPS